MNKRWAALAALGAMGGGSASAAPLVGPYLQDARPESIRVMWESDDGVPSEVEFGLMEGEAEGPGQTVGGTSAASNAGAVIHDVLLEGLQPGQRYWYSVAGSEARQRFRAPAARSAEAPLRLLAMSDMQQSGTWPDKYREIVYDGVLDYLKQRGWGDPHEALDAALIPGDLVDDGRNWLEWRETFFVPGAPLMAEVPFFPVPGNHENDAHWFFDYFQLPRNGTPGYEEHWWSTDLANVHLIGLDSNSDYWRIEQLDWLEADLAAACADDAVDFVFAQLHHPHRSELWRPGESPYTGQVVERLDAFADDCGKPVVHFFGHTHGYSRGTRRDHQHLMVNVATAGGAVDAWGAYEQRDYDEFAITTADWGFVVIEVEAGEEAQFTLRRISRGDALDPRENDQTDEVTIRRQNAPPQTPIGYGPGVAVNGAVPPVSGDCFSLEAGPLTDPDGDVHQASQWQVAAGCDGFDEPVQEVFRQDRNQYFGVDERRDAVLNSEPGLRLEAGDWCWRVRYRDAGLVWSDWSAGQSFTVEAPTHSAQLLVDPGAEDDSARWQREGMVRALPALHCDAPVPAAGSFGWGLGAGCSGGRGVLGQVVVLEERAPGWTHVRLEGQALLYPEGEGVARVLAQVGEEEQMLAELALPGSAPGSWTPWSLTAEVPAEASALMVLFEGSGAVVDALDLRLGPEERWSCSADWAPVLDDPLPTTPTGCSGCDQGATLGQAPGGASWAGAGWSLMLALWAGHRLGRRAVVAPRLTETGRG